MRGHILGAAVGLLTLVAAHPAAAQAPEPYRIGMTAAITGPFSAGYAPTYEGYRTYFKRGNEAGGVQRAPVGSNPEGGRGGPPRAGGGGPRVPARPLAACDGACPAAHKTR